MECISPTNNISFGKEEGKNAAGAMRVDGTLYYVLKDHLG
jgi:hypothetical protein